MTSPSEFFRKENCTGSIIIIQTVVEMTAISYEKLCTILYTIICNGEGREVK